MKLPKTIMITSCKGGVGKSTVTANLAAALAMAGTRTLACDCDFGMRCLDLVLGMEDEALYDIRDAATGKIPPEKACRPHPDYDGLFFCAAPYGAEFELTKDELSGALSAMAEAHSLDCIILDTPGDAGAAVKLAAEIADAAYIVSGAQPSALRGAGRTAELLRSIGDADLRLLINGFDLGGASLTKRGERPGISEMIDRTTLPLIGVVPEDKRLALLQEKGKLSFEDKRSTAAVAFRNIAERTKGGAVPVLSGIKCKKRSILL